MALGMHTVVARLLAYSALLLPASNREGFFREFLEDADDRIQSTTEKVLDDETTEDDLIEMQEGIRLEIERLIALARRMISS